MTADDPRLRFRLYLDGRLACEHWLDATNPEFSGHFDALQRHHKHRTDQADDNGTPWCIEVYDPAKPPRTAYTRFGTDTDGMIAPAPWSKP